jgi:hypothetical protein
LPRCTRTESMKMMAPMPLMPCSATSTPQAPVHTSRPHAPSCLRASNCQSRQVHACHGTMQVYVEKGSVHERFERVLNINWSCRGRERERCVRGRYTATSVLGTLHGYNTWINVSQVIKELFFLAETLPKLRFLWSFHLFGHHAT